MLAARLLIKVILMIKVLAASAVALSALLTSLSALAAEHEVKMLNKGIEGMMVFEPSVVKVAPGDSVHFIATDKSHNVESIEGMIPAGATPFKGEMNKDLTVTFEQPGVYGVKCKPHYGMGMVGLVVVGEPTNKMDAAAVVQKGKAKQKFENLFSQLGG
jgi:pseudoazurin